MSMRLFFKQKKNEMKERLTYSSFIIRIIIGQKEGLQLPALVLHYYGLQC